VVDLRIGIVLFVDVTSFVGVQTCRCFDAAGHGTACIYFSHDVLFAVHRAIVADLPDGVVGDSVTIVRCAGATGVEVGAVLVLRLVVVARFVWYSVGIGVGINGDIIATLATACVGAVDDVLHAQVSRRPCALS